MFAPPTCVWGGGGEQWWWVETRASLPHIRWIDPHADLAVFLILLQDFVSFFFDGICNLMKKVASSFTGQGLEASGGISGFDGQLPAGVWNLWRIIRVCTPHTLI